MSDDMLQSILESIAALKKRLDRSDTMEFGTAASLRAAGFALTSDIPSVPTIPTGIVIALLKKSATLPAVSAAAPGIVTVFTATIPANFMAGDNGVRFSSKMFIDTNASARNVTVSVVYGSTTVATSGSLSYGANLNFELEISGVLLTTAVNTQRCIMNWSNYVVSTTTMNQRVYKGTGAESASVSKSLILRVEVSGSVDSMVLYDAVVEKLTTS